jgi:hypothetical protein
LIYRGWFTHHLRLALVASLAAAAVACSPPTSRGKSTTKITVTGQGSGSSGDPNPNPTNTSSSLQILPALPADLRVAVSAGTLNFSATGGSAPYRYGATPVNGTTAGQFNDTNSGVFSVSINAGVSDITVTDRVGATRTARLEAYAPARVPEAQGIPVFSYNASAPPRTDGYDLSAQLGNRLQLVPRGGVQSVPDPIPPLEPQPGPYDRYRFSLVLADGSSAPAEVYGTVGTFSGLYQAPTVAPGVYPAAPSANAFFRIESLYHADLIAPLLYEFKVNPRIKLTVPNGGSAILSAGESLRLRATGGANSPGMPYTYWMVGGYRLVPPNGNREKRSAHGGIDSTGLYIAPSSVPPEGAIDVIGVRDRLGNEDYLEISIGAGITINPQRVTASPYSNPPQAERVSLRIKGGTPSTTSGTCQPPTGSPVPNKGYQFSASYRATYTDTDGSQVNVTESDLTLGSLNSRLVASLSGGESSIATPRLALNIAELTTLASPSWKCPSESDQYQELTINYPRTVGTGLLRILPAGQTGAQVKTVTRFEFTLKAIDSRTVSAASTLTFSTGFEIMAPAPIAGRPDIKILSITKGRNLLGTKTFTVTGGSGRYHARMCRQWKGYGYVKPVSGTSANFEYVPPTLEDFKQNWNSTSATVQGLPWSNLKAVDKPQAWTSANQVCSDTSGDGRGVKTCTGPVLPQICVDDELSLPPIVDPSSQKRCFGTETQQEIDHARANGYLASDGCETPATQLLPDVEVTPGGRRLKPAQKLLVELDQGALFFGSNKQDVIRFTVKDPSDPRYVYAVGTTEGALDGRTNQGKKDIFVTRIDVKTGLRYRSMTFGSTEDDLPTGAVMTEVLNSGTGLKYLMISGQTQGIIENGPGYTRAAPALANESFLAAVPVYPIIASNTFDSKRAQIGIDERADGAANPKTRVRQFAYSEAQFFGSGLNTSHGLFKAINESNCQAVFTPSVFGSLTGPQQEELKSRCAKSPTAPEWVLRWTHIAQLATEINDLTWIPGHGLYLVGTITNHFQVTKCSSTHRITGYGCPAGETTVSEPPAGYSYAPMKHSLVMKLGIDQLTGTGNQFVESGIANPSYLRAQQLFGMRVLGRIDRNETATGVAYIPAEQVREDNSLKNKGAALLITGASNDSARFDTAEQNSDPETPIPSAGCSASTNYPDNGINNRCQDIYVTRWPFYRGSTEVTTGALQKNDGLNEGASPFYANMEFLTGRGESHPGVFDSAPSADLFRSRWTARFGHPGIDEGGKIIYTASSASPQANPKIVVTALLKNATSGGGSSVPSSYPNAPHAKGTIYLMEYIDRTVGRAVGGTAGSFVFSNILPSAAPIAVFPQTSASQGDLKTHLSHQLTTRIARPGETEFVQAIATTAGSLRENASALLQGIFSGLSRTATTSTSSSTLKDYNYRHSATGNLSVASDETAFGVQACSTLPLDYTSGIENEAGSSSPELRDHFGTLLVSGGLDGTLYDTTTKTTLDPDQSNRPSADAFILGVTRDLVRR